MLGDGEWDVMKFMLSKNIVTSRNLKKFCVDFLFRICVAQLIVKSQNIIKEHCLNLKELDVSDARSLTSNVIRSIVDYPKHIENLCTSRCFGIAPATYLELEKCPNLKYLNVFGVMKDGAYEELKSYLSSIDINKFYFSSIARPTVGIKRTSIWNQRTREAVTPSSSNILPH